MQAILGQKRQQTQKFLQDGTRIPVTEVSVMDNPVIAIKTPDRDGYWAVQLGCGTQKHPHKALLGHSKGAKLEKAPLFLREIRLSNPSPDELPKVGDLIKVTDVLQPGDIIEVTGTSKGKGFAGGVKRFHFKGGPRTHGQSDRERAPGSIGQTTTPGRVYKGKRMAGKMGNDRVTIKNLQIVDVSDGVVLVDGLIPGTRNSLVIIRKIGENKKFVPLVAVEQKTIDVKPEEKQNA